MYDRIDERYPAVFNNAPPYSRGYWSSPISKVARRWLILCGTLGLLGLATILIFGLDNTPKPSDLLTRVTGSGPSQTITASSSRRRGRAPHVPRNGISKEDITEELIAPYWNEVDGTDRIGVFQRPRRPLTVGVDPKFYDCPPVVLNRYNAHLLEPEASEAEVDEEGREINARNLKVRGSHSQEGEEKYMVQHFFSHPNFNHTNGVFVEIGAYDGMMLSNTLALERQFGWSGLLIEGVTESYAKLEKNRISENVTTLHACVCNSPQVLQLGGTGATAGIGLGKEISTCPCLEMDDILAMAMGDKNHIDFYSIDVEGAELDLLLSHDWGRVPVHTALVEMRPGFAKTNAELRYALHTVANLCRFDNIVGHENEVWINPSWPCSVDGTGERGERGDCGWD